MGSEWMGRYRPLVAALVQHTNINEQKADARFVLEKGIAVSLHEWQVLEYIILHEAEQERMIHISEQLGIPQSSFSKMVTNLCRLGLVEKHQAAGNRKNVILKPSRRAKEIYRARTRTTREEMFAPFFDCMKDWTDEELTRFTRALEVFNETLQALQRRDEARLQEEEKAR